MDKTPGQVIFEVMTKQGFKDATLEECEELAAAVIAHARPQIEAAARAAVVKEVRERIKSEHITDSSGESMGYRQGYNECADVLYDEIELIATAPPGYVCVVVDEIEHLKNVAKDTNARLDALIAAARPK